MKRAAHMSRHLQHAGVDMVETHSNLIAKYPPMPLPVVSQSVDANQRQRRSGAHWSYHFYPVESYLDVTFILPYPIVLNQIVIRMNSAALQNNPAAVQVECCSDMDPRSFMLLGPVTSTWGQSLVRIPAENYHYSIQMVRFHFKRPIESENMNIVQISLLGVPVDVSHSEFVMEKSRCLDLLHFCLKFDDVRETIHANYVDFRNEDDTFFSLLINIIESISCLLKNVFSILNQFILENRSTARRTLALTLWVTSCIIWRCRSTNSSSDFQPLFQSTVTLLRREQSYGELYTTLTHFLNSLCYRHPAFVHQLTGGDKDFKQLLHSIPNKKIFAECSITNTVASMCEAIDNAEETLKILAAASQNPPATKYLFESGIIGKVMTILTYLCEAENTTSSFKRLNQIGTLIEFLAVLSRRRIVASSILNLDWKKCWISIFDYLCKKEFDSELIRRENYQKLNANLTTIVENCTAFDLSNHKLICEILRDCLSKYGLTLFLKSFFIRILLEERSALVVIDNPKVYYKSSSSKHLEKPTPKVDKSLPFVKMTAECPISQASMVCYPKKSSDARSSTKSNAITITSTRAAPDTLRSVIFCEDLLKNDSPIPEDTSLAQLMANLAERSRLNDAKKPIEIEPRFLRLKIRETNLADEKNGSNQFLSQIEPESILLVHFAELGGLALLARYLTLDNIPETRQLIEKRRPPKRTTQKVQSFSIPHVDSTDEEDYAYQDYFSGFSPTETGSAEHLGNR
uniref:Uncharacterized protein n=1 Tax=Romanomermis culicivorax TaxID=13658 RepID=A0A915KG07_ROMCU